jgi:hypothetical protein
MFISQLSFSWAVSLSRGQRHGSMGLGSANRALFAKKIEPIQIYKVTYRQVCLAKELVGFWHQLSVSILFFYFFDVLFSTCF